MGSDGASVPPASQSMMGDIKTEDLVSDIKISYGKNIMKITGHARKIVHNWEDFSSDPSEQTGHFVPTILPAETVGQQITIKGRSAGDKKVTGPEDRILITRLENLSEQKAIIEMAGETLLTIDFSGMTQDELPTGNQAVTFLPNQDFGECGNSKDWFDGSAAWSGSTCTMTGKFKKGTLSEAAGKYNLAIVFDASFNDKSVKVGKNTWNKDNAGTPLIGHYTGLEASTQTVDITCDDQIIARFDLSGCTFE